MKLSAARSQMYRGARLLGDYQAVRSGSPSKIGKRIVRKTVGRRYGALMRRWVK